MEGNDVPVCYETTTVIELQVLKKPSPCRARLFAHAVSDLAETNGASRHGKAGYVFLDVRKLISIAASAATSAFENLSIRLQ